MMLEAPTASTLLPSPLHRGTHEKLRLTQAAPAEPATPGPGRRRAQSCLCSRHSDSGQSQAALQSAMERKLRQQ